jgi:hypothetical protein
VNDAESKEKTENMPDGHAAEQHPLRHCVALRRSGRPCTFIAKFGDCGDGLGAAYCFFHRPEHAEPANNKRRIQVPKKKEELSVLSIDGIVARAIACAENVKSDKGMDPERARAVGQLLKVAVDALKARTTTGDLETRTSRPKESDEKLTEAPEAPPGSPLSELEDALRGDFDA